MVKVTATLADRSRSTLSEGSETLGAVAADFPAELMQGRETSDTNTNARLHSHVLKGGFMLDLVRALRSNRT